MSDEKQLILRCDCKHEFQDKQYGKGRRVHTTNEKGRFRCTVCGKEK